MDRGNLDYELRNEVNKMGGFGGDLTDFGQTNALVLKNIDAKYRAPKNARLFGLAIEDAEVKSIAELIARIPQNYIKEQTTVTGDKWEDGFEWFSGKDGQTNAYVKRGMDYELVEVADGTETPVVTWHFATDDTHVDFMVGGKVYTMNREWTVMKIITQFSRGTTSNKFYAMTTVDNDLARRIGVKTLVLV